MGEKLRGVSMAGSRVISGRNRRFAAAVVLGAVVAAGVFGAGFLSPDRLLERSYARSAPLGTIHLDEIVSDGHRALPVTKAADRRMPPPILMVNGVNVPSGVLAEPLTVGARVRLAPGAADPREVEVIDAEDMDAPVIGLPGLRFQSVTARLLDAPEGETMQLVFAVREPVRAKTVPASSSQTAGKVL